MKNRLAAPENTAGYSNARMAAPRPPVDSPRIKTGFVLSITCALMRGRMTVSINQDLVG